MLCCVPAKRPADGRAPPFDDEAPSGSPSSVRREIQIELYPEEDALPPILLPCAICARTFMPQSLEKHARICERAVARKRKPFDSAKQRIQGTELAEFLPKQETRRHQDERPGCAIAAARPSWKKSRDDFLRAIREARGDAMDSHKQCNSLILSGAPTRANEKGTCPTCNRHFGIKAYDRHVAWCKERITRMPMSPATNLAKERLEARMRYRAPALKNRRAANREKYSPVSTVNQGGRTASSSLAFVKPKESVSAPSCNRESPAKQRPAAARRPGQPKQSPTSSKPMKSRLADRTNKPAEDHDTLPAMSRRLSHLAVSFRRPLRFPVPPSRPKIGDPIHRNEIALSSPSKRQSDQNETIGRRASQNDEARDQEACSARTQRNVVSSRSQGHPRINDVAVNDKALGVTIQPCRIHKDSQKDGQLTTWRQISRKKSNPQIDDAVISRNSPRESQFLDPDDRPRDREEEIDSLENENRTEADGFAITQNQLARVDDELKLSEDGKVDDGDVMWLSGIQNLNQTYLIRDSEDVERSEIFCGKWRPIKHSPRVEFYFKDTRDTEAYELDKKKLTRESVGNDEDIGERKAEESKLNNKDKENILKDIGNEADDAEHEAEKFKIDSEDRKDNREMIDNEAEVRRTEHRVKKIKVNSEDGKDTREASDADVAELDEPSVTNKRDKRDKRVVASEGITENPKRTEARETFEEIEDPLNSIASDWSDSNERIKLPALDVAHPTAPDAVQMKEHEDSCSKESWPSADNNDFLADKKSSRSKHEDSTLRLYSRNSLASSNSFVLSSEYRNCDLNLKDETYRCEDDKCSDNPLEFKGSTATFICGRSDKNNPTFLNDCGDGVDHSLNSEDGASPCQNIIQRDSLDLKEDVEGLSPSTACRADGREMSAAKEAEEIETNGERHGSTGRPAKERPANSVEMRRKIRESMNFLRGSTDSLISSIEIVELACIRRPEAGRAYERETIEIIRPSRRCRVFGGLPDIKGESTETREHTGGTSDRPVDRMYWERASKISRSRLVSLEPSYHARYRLAKRNPRVRILPPVPSSSSNNRRQAELATRPAWCNYVRRRPDFNLVLKARTGTCKDYDPFVLAEQQMNDLLSDTSEQSVRASPKTQTRDTLYPLSHSSAFVKYPYQTSLVKPDRRSSLIAPPFEFDDLVSDVSSDSTETNSIAREVFLEDRGGGEDATDAPGPGPVRQLGRRLIIDRSKALGGDPNLEERRGVVAGGSADRPRKSLDRLAPVAPKVTRSLVDRANATRASSAPRTTLDRSDRKTPCDARRIASKPTEGQRSSDHSLNRRNNNYSSLSGSNLSLSSIFSSETDIKRSNSVFDELMTSLEEDIAFPGLRSFLNNEPFDVSSPVNGDRQRNGIVSDEELSSPDSYKPQDHSKLSNDSAYSSLNRKYSHHGRSTNDVAGRLDEDAPVNETSPQTTKCKMSKYCHECGLRFPENAKFCCECGVRRLAL